MHTTAPTAALHTACCGGASVLRCRELHSRAGPAPIAGFGRTLRLRRALAARMRPRAPDLRSRRRRRSLCLRGRRRRRARAALRGRRRRGGRRAAAARSRAAMGGGVRIGAAAAFLAGR